MLFYIVRRFFYAITLLLMLSIAAFILIELPPGDFLSTYIILLGQQGVEATEAQLLSIRRQYALDLPIYARYFKWLGGIFHGNFGRSFRWNLPVAELLAERVPLTIIISLLALIFSYCVAVPIGIYSATRHYSIGDYVFTVIGFVGLAIPNFLFALILVFFFYKYFDLSVGGLFSSQYLTVAWSLDKFIDMLKHLPIPIIVIGTANTAWLIRTMRGCLLDELKKQYVITARAKGVVERTLLFKYPVRVAINPVISTISWLFPSIVSGETITAIVLNLPTTGPLLYEALLSQDVFLAGGIVMLLGSLVILGTFISDILLVWLDPRIRYER